MVSNRLASYRIGSSVMLSGIDPVLFATGLITISKSSSPHLHPRFSIRRSFFVPNQIPSRSALAAPRVVRRGRDSRDASRATRLDPASQRDPSHYVRRDSVGELSIHTPCRLNNFCNSRRPDCVFNFASLASASERVGNSSVCIQIHRRNAFVDFTFPGLCRFSRFPRSSVWPT